MEMIRENRKKHFAFNLAMTLILFVFLVSAAVFIILAIKPLYYGMIKWFRIDETSGYTVKEIKENYSALIDYNMFWGPAKLKFPTLPMSEHGEIHFMEVKRIFVVLQYAGLISLLLLIPGAIYAKKKKITAWPKAAAVLTIAVIAVVGFGLVFFWDETFVLFHKIMFNNDFWLFDYRLDPVILILPDSVFLADAAGILIAMALGLAGFIIGFGKKRKNG